MSKFLKWAISKGLSIKQAAYFYVVYGEQADEVYIQEERVVSSSQYFPNSTVTFQKGINRDYPLFTGLETVEVVVSIDTFRDMPLEGFILTLTQKQKEEMEEVKSKFYKIQNKTIRDEAVN